MNNRFKEMKAMQTKDKIRTQFVARLKEAMINAGVSEWGAGAYLAKLTKTTPKASSKWLNAESMPGRKNMETLAEALGVRVEWLEYGEGDKTSERSPAGQEHAQLASQLFNRVTPRTQVALKRIQELAAQDKLSDADIDMLMQIAERIGESS